MYVFVMYEEMHLGIFEIKGKQNKVSSYLSSQAFFQDLPKHLQTINMLLSYITVLYLPDFVRFKR